MTGFLTRPFGGGFMLPTPRTLCSATGEHASPFAPPLDSAGIAGGASSTPQSTGGTPAEDTFVVATPLPERRLSDARPVDPIAHIAAGKFFDIGNEYEQKGNLRKAAELYQAALLHNPRHTEASAALASIDVRTGDHRFTLDRLADEVSRRPRNAQAHATLGIVSATMGDFDYALFHLDCAIVLAPREPGHRISRGRVHMQFRQFAKAIGDFTTAFALDGQNTVALIFRGFAHRHNGNENMWRSDMKQARMLNPDGFDVSLKLVREVFAHPF